MWDATEAEIVEHLAKGQAQLWAGERCAFVTQVRDGETRFLHVWLAGGDMDELLIEMRPQIEAFAKVAGCSDIIMAGRKGWVRTMRKYGYADVWVALRKELP